jgi:hypothetical protein
MKREAAHPAKNRTRSPKAVLAWLMPPGLPEADRGRQGVAAKSSVRALPHVAGPSSGSGGEQMHLMERMQEHYCAYGLV